ncbi:cytochrome c oxidase assembly protein [Cellulomonas endophytica]|uniref:cytochrome c oxidase assembly protein n=1 Tax=Cellulomonas endophytica TaxID=2494735 RepID=UPI00101331CE|nr:cytochrome c oxidase assembly protein [Cellulomonas endophytica]
MLGEFDGPAVLPQQAPSLAAYLSWTSPQPVPVLPAIGLLLAVAYLAGAVRMWRAGRRWPARESALFFLGCLVLIIVTGADIEGYGLEMFSVFMFQQLTLMIAVPMLLVLGRPGTLLLKATPTQGRGRWVRAAALRALRSSAARAAVHPAVTVPLFLALFYGLYLGSTGSWLLQRWQGHLALEVMFFISGLLFTAPVLSTDPLPRRQGHGARLADMAVEMPLHAFFGVLIMMAPQPMVAAFAHPPTTWGVEVLDDQRLAGGLAWSYGELPNLIVVLVLAARWHRDEDRRNRVNDRRTDDPELEEYNAYLQSLADRTQAPGPLRSGPANVTAPTDSDPTR